MFLVTHDSAVAGRADRIVHVEEGRVLHAGIRVDGVHPRDEPATVA